MTLEQARKLKIGALLTVITVTLAFLIPNVERCLFFARAYSPFPCELPIPAEDVGELGHRTWRRAQLLWLYLERAQ